ncbi:MAG: hypothetical protein DF280_03520 ['Brassica napus' phytoplasma]|nr:MAG: hypothetical protein DF280_03520 ['Brassica napus' phytoplasma]
MIGLLIYCKQIIKSKDKLKLHGGKKETPYQKATKLPFFFIAFLIAINKKNKYVPNLHKKPEKTIQNQQLFYCIN